MGAAGPITLGALAFACYAYDAVTGYDESLYAFQDLTGGAFDLDDSDHRLALLAWLNHWGCRHLARAHHSLASEQLARWHGTVSGQLPGPTDRLIHLDDDVLDEYAPLFESLSGLTAALGSQNGHSFTISLGPTAAAKTLFALRPHVFVAWDEPIRRKLGHDGSGASYVEFLKGVRCRLGQIAEQSSRLDGTDLEDLPTRLGRPRSTAAQLIDEYYWITITRGIAAPDPERLRAWLAWG